MERGHRGGRRAVFPRAEPERFDPNGAYIREWVPELRDVPPGRLCVPLAPGLRLAKDYPPPMLDHSIERDKTLAMFKAHRAGERMKDEG